MSDTTALDSLYRAHHGWLQAFLRRRLGRADSARDLVHDVFLKLLAREDAIGIREPRAFLTTIAQRVLVSHWRRAQLEQAYLDALAALPEASAPSEEARTVLLETLYEIDRLLDGLPRVVKRAFLLSQLDGMGQAEIAVELGVSLATVKRYLVTAARQCYFAAELAPPK